MSQQYVPQTGSSNSPRLTPTQGMEQREVHASLQHGRQQPVSSVGRATTAQVASAFRDLYISGEGPKAQSGDHPDGNLQGRREVKQEIDPTRFATSDPEAGHTANDISTDESTDNPTAPKEQVTESTAAFIPGLKLNNKWFDAMAKEHLHRALELNIDEMYCKFKTHYFEHATPIYKQSLEIQRDMMNAHTLAVVHNAMEAMYKDKSICRDDKTILKILHHNIKDLVHSTTDVIIPQRPMHYGRDYD